MTHFIKCVGAFGWVLVKTGPGWVSDFMKCDGCLWGVMAGVSDVRVHKVCHLSLWRYKRVDGLDTGYLILDAGQGGGVS